MNKIKGNQVSLAPLSSVTLEITPSETKVIGSVRDNVRVRKLRKKGQYPELISGTTVRSQWAIENAPLTTGISFGLPSATLQYDEPAIVSWSMPNHEVADEYTLDTIDEINYYYVGLQAYHASGIQKIEMALNGGAYIEALYGNLKDSNIFEYYCLIPETELLEGLNEVRAKVTPINGVITYYHGYEEYTVGNIKTNSLVYPEPRTDPSLNFNGNKLTATSFFVWKLPANHPEIYVDLQFGNDFTGTGTKSNPFKTIEGAHLNYWKDNSFNLSENIYPNGAHIYVYAGYTGVPYYSQLALNSGGIKLPFVGATAGTPYTQFLFPPVVIEGIVDEINRKPWFLGITHFENNTQYFDGTTIAAGITKSNLNMTIPLLTNLRNIKFGTDGYFKTSGVNSFPGKINNISTSGITYTARSYLSMRECILTGGPTMDYFIAGQTYDGVRYGHIGVTGQIWYNINEKVMSIGSNPNSNVVYNPQGYLIPHNYSARLNVNSGTFFYGQQYNCLFTGFGVEPFFKHVRKCLFEYTFCGRVCQDGICTGSTFRAFGNQRFIDIYNSTTALDGSIKDDLDNPYWTPAFNTDEHVDVWQPTELQQGQIKYQIRPNILSYNTASNRGFYNFNSAQMGLVKTHMPIETQSRLLSPTGITQFRAPGPTFEFRLDGLTGMINDGGFVFHGNDWKDYIDDRSTMLPPNFNPVPSGTVLNFQSSASGGVIYKNIIFTDNKINKVRFAAKEENAILDIDNVGNFQSKTGGSLPGWPVFFQKVYMKNNELLPQYIASTGSTGDVNRPVVYKGESSDFDNQTHASNHRGAVLYTGYYANPFNQYTHQTTKKIEKLLTHEFFNIDRENCFNSIYNENQEWPSSVSYIGTNSLFYPITVSDFTYIGSPSIGYTMSVQYNINDGFYDSADRYNPNIQNMQYYNIFGEKNNFDLSIQWLRDGVEISGATSDEYLIQSSDSNKELSVRINFNHFDGRGISYTSTPIVINNAGISFDNNKYWIIGKPTSARSIAGDPTGVTYVGFCDRAENAQIVQSEALASSTYTHLKGIFARANNDTIFYAYDTPNTNQAERNITTHSNNLTRVLSNTGPASVCALKNLTTGDKIFWASSTYLSTGLCGGEEYWAGISGDYVLNYIGETGYTLSDIGYSSSNNSTDITKLFRLVNSAERLSQVLGNFNTESDVGDYTGDGIVNAQDLSYVLSNWTPEFNSNNPLANISAYGPSCTLLRVPDGPLNDTFEIRPVYNFLINAALNNDQVIFEFGATYGEVSILQ